MPTQVIYIILGIVTGSDYRFGALLVVPILHAIVIDITS